MSEAETPPPSPPPRRLFAFHAPIQTGTGGVSWSAILLLSFVWFAFLFHIFAAGTALTFTLRRYTEDPRIISFVFSISGLVGLVVGPTVNFLSDRIWTRFGRRKPFVLVAFSVAALAFALIPLVPSLAESVNGLLGALGLGPIREFFFLVAIIVSYGSLYHFTGPLEPICLECVPVAQRGRFWAMRGILSNLASLYFFQLLFPVFDMEVPLFNWPVGGGTASLTGEQMIYVLTSAMFFMTTLFLAFNVREVRDPTAPNENLRDIKIGAFVVSFFKQVFLDKQWYPLYVILVIPGITGLVWGNLMNLMVTEQFGYSKPDLALLGLPAMVISIVFITPFAGWYSDRKPQVPVWLQTVLAVVGTACLGVTAQTYSHLSVGPQELPPMWECFLLCGMISVGVLAWMVVIIEIVLRFTNREDMRVWISGIAMVKDVIFTAAMYLLIQYGSEGRIPPITLWMLAGQFGATSGALLGVVIGPMIFEYIPRNKFGTIISGTGIFNGMMGFAFANIGASWMVFYTQNIGDKPLNGAVDYSSGYLLQLLLAPIALGVKGYFIYLVVKGKLFPYGRHGQ